ncbi:hypothetical protein SBDP1_310036 [Syntrophobacter sp. SbD1]|nr:hypothetical protein SBDP1_310036 [Syntrophobacter sp. SbD1]
MLEPCAAKVACTVPRGLGTGNGPRLPDVYLVSKTSGNQFYTITSGAGTGGNVSPSGSLNAISGGDYTFSFTPTILGYCISNVTVDGNSVGTVTGSALSNATTAILL